MTPCQLIRQWNRKCRETINGLGALFVVSLCLAGCGGSAGQSTQPIQAVGATSNTSASNASSDNTTSSNDNCTTFSGSNLFGQSIVNTQFCTLDHADTEREYFIHVPESDADSAPMPLVLSFHGYTSTAETNLGYTGLQPFAESEKFIVVYPQGTVLASTGETHWNSGGSDNKSGADDVGFVETLLDQLEETQNIDTDRIYAIGMSNGGMMSYLLACRLSQRIAAITSVTGSMTVDSATCTASRPVSVMQIHGVEDRVVPFDGNGDFPSIPKTVEFWAESNGCVGDPKESNIADITGDGHGGVRTQYLDCSQGVQVDLIALAEVGHDWPINVEGYRAHDVHAAGEIWQFLKQFSLYGKIE
jgi:polyhydroxybutyrate depolymerase